MSKKLITLLGHGSLLREEDGAIEFWRIKDNLHTHFLYCHHWSDEKLKNSMARGGGGGNKKRYQYCTDPVLRKSKHVLLVKKLGNMIERGNPLSAVMKITSNQLLSALSKHLIHVSLVKVRT